MDMIKSALDELPDRWYPEGKRDIAALSDLLGYLEEHRELSTPQSTPRDPAEVPYHASPFHFFLYYWPKPNFPFVTSMPGSLVFGAFTGRRRNNINLSFPYYRDVDAAIRHLNRSLSYPALISLLEHNRIERILLRDIDDEFANVLRKRKKRSAPDRFRLTSLRELNYRVYDPKRTLAAEGRDFKNLRWHLNRFESGGKKVEAVPLSEYVEPVLHLIGQWRRRALKRRGFSYADVRSDKLAARAFGNDPGHASRDPPPYSSAREPSGPLLDGPSVPGKTARVVTKAITGRDVISRVLKIGGKVRSFNLGFPLGLRRRSEVFAHSVGIADNTVPHLSEYAQIDFWNTVNKAECPYVNDGPTWRKGLGTYKEKFRPVGMKRRYWATLTVV